MSSRLKTWFTLSGLAAGILAAVWAIHAYRYRWVHSDADLVGLLPRSPQYTQYFVNVASLRQAGLLRFLTGSREAEYRTFERETGFEYARDLDTLTGASNGMQTYFVVRGRFDTGQIRQYAKTHGGDCTGEICRMPGTRPGSFVSLLSIQPDVLALAVAADKFAAQALAPHQRASLPAPIPTDPVWVQVSSALLKNPAALPFGLRIFAISLQPADSVLLALNRANSSDAQAPFRLELRAVCTNPATARTIRSQLELQTSMLKLELAREHQTANKGDLTGLLTAGSFDASKNQVIGNWPVSSALLGTLQ